MAGRRWRTPAHMLDAGRCRACPPAPPRDDRLGADPATLGRGGRSRRRLRRGPAGVRPGAIGRARSELVTPALVLDLRRGAAQHRAHGVGRADLGSTIRPHIKVHKSPELARLQVEAGAIGLSVATVWEAVVMAAAGLDHLFIVNTVAGAAKIRTVAELARGVDLMVAVDDAVNAAALAAAARAAGSTIGVMIEVDTGMDRAWRGHRGRGPGPRPRP